MTIQLHPHEIEKLLEECMPSYQAVCSRLTDGSLVFQFKGRADNDSFSIVGIRSDDCCSQEKVRSLGKAFLEDLAFAQAEIRTQQPNPAKDTTLAAAH
ncbi:MAG: hypothetical protein ABWY06_05260 [Pseudomonas sp.]|uniref:hypothetical protein n=1 Tax=Pseudomonas sp. TaxID=306 RepID=UPI003392A5A6